MNSLLIKLILIQKGASLGDTGSLFGSSSGSSFGSDSNFNPNPTGLGIGADVGTMMSNKNFMDNDRRDRESRSDRNRPAAVPPIH